METTIPPAVLGFFLVHAALRREAHGVADDAALLRDGDEHGARSLARRVVLLERVVHVHHRGEDDLLWPLLARHADLDAAAFEAEHDAVDAGLATLHAEAVAVAHG